MIGFYTLLGSWVIQFKDHLRLSLAYTMSEYLKGRVVLEVDLSSNEQLKKTDLSSVHGQFW